VAARPDVIDAWLYCGATQLQPYEQGMLPA
jgi:hypothetical protein